MIRKTTVADWLRYQFDNTMARGAIALIGWLALLSALLIVVASAFVAALGVAPADQNGETVGFAGLLWTSLMRAIDTGNLAGDTGSPLFVGSMLVVTLGGIFFVSVLIGVINTG